MAGQESHGRGRAVTAAIVSLICAGVAAPSDWPPFRGPNGTGVSDERGLPAEIGPDRNVLWSVKAPKGHSSPIVVGGRVVLTGHESDAREVLCYDAASGALLWRRRLARARGETFHPMNGPATPTPATDGRNVFAFGARP